MQDEILTLPEVAQLLKVAEKTVYSMAQKGQLPAFKVGGQWRFKRVDIDQWIEQRKAARATTGSANRRCLTSRAIASGFETASTRAVSARSRTTRSSSCC
jgi:excisionase family DNA binding protein